METQFDAEKADWEISFANEPDEEKGITFVSASHFDWHPINVFSESDHLILHEDIKSTNIVSVTYAADYEGMILPKGRTSNLPDLEYRITLKRELARQKDEIVGVITRAKDETIQTLLAECDGLRKQHKTLQEDHVRIEKQLERLSRENASMGELLSKKYSAKNLFIISSFVILALSGSLLLYLTHGITLIDPFLATVTLAVSAAFSGLSIWRFKKEERTNFQS